MKWKDPIVEEVRQIREAIAAEHNHDIRALVKHYQQRQSDKGRKLVTRMPKRIPGQQTPRQPTAE